MTQRRAQCKYPYMVKLEIQFIPCGLPLSSEVPDLLLNQPNTTIERLVEGKQRPLFPALLQGCTKKGILKQLSLSFLSNAGQNVQCPNADEIIYTLHEREYVEKIEKAYGYASKTLLDLLMDERALMDRLRYGVYLT